MDAPGTNARHQYNRSSVLFAVGAGLLVVAILMVVTVVKNGVDATRWALFLGLWVITPASAITWVLSFQAIRRRPAVAVISAAVAYLLGLILFVMLLVNVGGVQP